ncbi:3-hydroxyisobutyrate dehydrogenase [Ammoniphilus resinae]|uniref:3-hydroxyisobutyrate dehydrogenase n=2 Tax=Ammoniphilus resinae TaxID=861532 RepID=A0ABS4GQV6_9BACL|nr:3-hydroxyisobutyrate dehydrogenase [Ammoniphilus resinae]
MKTIGMIGLGTMGAGMADNLLKDGFSLVVWNRTAEKALPFKEKGAKVVSSPFEVAQHSDAIITMLSADQQLKEVLLGENGVIEGVKPGQIIIDSSTVSPLTSRELHQIFAERDVQFLDAPVTGSAPQAKDGILGFMVGGSKDAYEKSEVLFKSMGKSWVYMGESGAGATTKLISNTMVGISLLALSEGMTMAQKSNLDLEKFLSVVAAGGANSRMVEMKSGKLIEEDYSVQFAVALMNKDLGLAYNLAESLKVVTPALGLAKQMFTTSTNKGLGDEDVASVFKLYQEWGNLK